MIETDIKKLTTVNLDLTTAIQGLTAAIQGGATISPATTAAVATAVDNLAVTQQAQMDTVPTPAPVPVQPVIQEAVATVLTQDIVVKQLTDAMARLGVDGQAKVVGALTANFGTHKVPEIQPAQWPQVIAVVQHLV